MKTKYVGMREKNCLGIAKEENGDVLDSEELAV